jgi:hypothetical protein
MSPSCFEPKWIRGKAKELQPVDPLLLEKCIHALALLGHLAETGLDFMFKGGTSILLLLDPVRRISTDIDIICAADPRDLDQLLSGIGRLRPFTGMKEQARGFRGLPNRRHFQFFHPTLDARAKFGGYVLLDVVEEKRCPHVTQERMIRTPFIEVEREVKVTMPTVESLLGDKLAAFAPTTIGVPLHPDDGQPADLMQIAKQFFDVGELFNAASDFQVVRKVYDGIFALEAEYRNHCCDREAAWRDTLGACLGIAMENLKGDKPSADTQALRNGWRRVSSHLIQHRFGLDDARVASGKAALLATAILANADPLDLVQLRYVGSPEPLAALAGRNIAKPEWRGLNRIKATNAGAFHYWCVADELTRIKAGGLA